jgi:effector-binding domain-containing protein
MEQSLGMDYERGLKMLKSLIETGAIHSQLELVGKREQPAMHYVGIDQQAKIAQLGEVIPNDFQKISNMLSEAGIEPSGAPFTLYYSMDMDTGINTLRNCIPVTSKVDVAQPFVCDVIEPSNTYVVKHTGAYPFVGNAWAFAMFAARHHKVKLKKKPVGYEYYTSDPVTTAPQDLITEIVLFAK